MRRCPGAVFFLSVRFFLKEKQPNKPKYLASWSPIVEKLSMFIVFIASISKHGASGCSKCQPPETSERLAKNIHSQEPLWHKPSNQRNVKGSSLTQVDTSSLDIEIENPPPSFPPWDCGLSLDVHPCTDSWMQIYFNKPWYTNSSRADLNAEYNITCLRLSFEFMCMHVQMHASAKLMLGHLCSLRQDHWLQCCSAWNL